MKAGAAPAAAVAVARAPPRGSPNSLLVSTKRLRPGPARPPGLQRPTTKEARRPTPNPRSPTLLGGPEKQMVLGRRRSPTSRRRRPKRHWMRRGQEQLASRKETGVPEEPVTAWRLNPARSVLWEARRGTRLQTVRKEKVEQSPFSSILLVMLKHAYGSVGMRNS